MRNLLGKGFSLPELLVVIAILVVIMAITLPAVRRAIRQARSTVCMHNLHDIGQALQTYRIDNRGWLPEVASSGTDQPFGPHAAAWFGRLFPRYIADLAVLACPDDPLREWLTKRVSLEYHPDPANASSYGMSEFIRIGGWGNLDRFLPRRPVETLLIADMGPDQVVDIRGHRRPVEPVHRTGGRLLWDDGYDPGAAGTTFSWLTTRHLGRINVMTVGGEVKPVLSDDLMGHPIRSHYAECAVGGCPLCRDLALAHYSFARDRVYWWTGPLPAVNRVDDQ